ncbi:MAG: SAF domain-containing protein [Actinobacteria bacterium]|nr:SAF domain-containing protein [Actinomycetota bacterium]
MHLLNSLRRAARWHRRGLAALLVAIAVLAGLNALSARTGADSRVVVAERTIPAGSTVSASDLSLAAVPSSVVAEGALTDLAQAIGHITVVEVPARQVVTGTLLLGDEGGVGPGLVGLPVSFGTSGAVSLLQVGSRIDILGPDPTGSAYGVVAANVRVAALPSVDDAGVLANSTSRLVVLEVSSAQAAAIAASMSVSSLSFAVH